MAEAVTSVFWWTSGHTPTNLLSITLHEGPGKEVNGGVVADHPWSRNVS
jgi:hypothetical protein